MKNLTLSRRTLIGAGLAAAAGAMLDLRPMPANALGKMPLADGEVLIVSDGGLVLPVASTYPNVDKTELLALLEAGKLPTDMLKPDCNVTFVRRGDRLIAFDAGSGANFMPSAGKLLENIEEAGINPEEVTDVLFTHAHPDHIWGVLDELDELVFPNAQYRISQAEWDFWSSPDTLAAMPEERKSFVIGAQNRFAAIEEKTSFFKAGDEVLSGIEAVDSHGHTAGHTSFLLHGPDPVIIIGDAISNSVISLQQPAWPTASDHDPDEGVKTRLALLDRLATDKVRVVGFHFPHPGMGRIERKDSGFRLVDM